MPPERTRGRSASRPPSPKRWKSARASRSRRRRLEARQAGAHERVAERGAPRQKRVALRHERAGAAVDRARRRPLETGEEAQQRGLADAARADHRDDLPGAGDERDAVDDVAVAVREDEVVRADHGRASAAASTGLDATPLVSSQRANASITAGSSVPNARPSASKIVR